ncbi:hypothetical protein [Staphylococcus gallinarum]|uniref:hypothetical protein n=1 Tax=Staphylococcus gallinarum TaxID=1293 RepID=UPI0024415947|nr:hypothetical protein [Staphylococcus gallinarum]
MITTIAIAILALAIIINTFSIWRVSRNKENTRFISSRPLSEYTSYKTDNRITTLEETLEYAQPLIDKYKKERKQNHWKQYNDWKRLYESKHGRCAQCHGEDLDIDTDYKYKAEKYESWYVREIVDYPLSAKYKCNTCGEVISKWQFKEDN